jgi:hypothetical protein
MREAHRNLYEHLRLGRERPLMYLGAEKIEYLERYLHGYKTALSIHGITEPGVPSFDRFISTVRWCRRSLR